MKYSKFFILSILAIFIQNSAISQESIEGPMIICPASEYPSDNYVPPPAYFLQRYARSQEMPVTANIVVTYIGFEGFEDAKAAFQYAVNIWSTLLKSDITIYVEATYEELSSGVLGSAGATGYRRDFEGAPREGTWYPMALAEKLSKTNLNEDGVPDIRASFSSVFDWYLGTDGNTGGKYDFATVVLHELGHGLGFIDIAVGQGESSGTGTNLASGYPSVYTHFIQDGSNVAALDLDNNSTELGDFIVSNNLFLNGPLAVTSNSNAQPKIYAPASYSSGSSISHWDENTFNNTSDALMTPQVGSGEVNHHPGDITLSIFADMGWVHTFLKHKPTFIMNSFTDDILITLDFSSDTTMASTDATLHYSIDDFASETVVTMVDNGNGNYSFPIPNPGEDIELQYYISGFEDALGRKYTLPYEVAKTKFSTIIRNSPLLSTPFLVKEGGDFETVSGFYSVPLEGDVNIWERGVPSGTLATPTSGTNVWKTDLDANLTRPDENYASALISPIFDLSEEVAHYELKFNLRMDIPADFLNVGLNVLYSIDGGASFDMLGKVNDGLGTNWYNLQDLNTLYSIGGDGWLMNNATANEALSVSYNLSELAGNDKVVFALVAYVRRSVNDEAYDIDGILIDDFEITKTEPQAKYYIKGSKINFPGNEIQFNFASSGADTYSWDFGDGSASSDLKNPTHSYATGGDYDVSLSITYPGGSDTKVVEKGVLIISNQGSSYSLADGGDFESNFSNFLVDNIKGTKFELGKSDITGKDGTASGDNAWITGINDDNYANQSEAFLYTPLFDLKFLGEYQLSFDAKYEFEDGWDGFIVEYTLDSAKTWAQLIPTVQDGWYDREAVQDNTAEGWPLIPMFTGSTGGDFITKSVSLSTISGNPSVGFRFHFKSDFLETDVGLALDNFQLTAPEFGAVVADFSYDLDDGCVTEEVIFSSTSTGGIVSAAWDFGAGASPASATGIESHTVTYETSGERVITLTLKDENGNDFVSTQTLELGEVHMPTFTTNGLVNGLILTSSEAETYQWYLNGAAIEGATSQTLQAPSNGNYRIEAVVNGCKGLSATASFITSINEKLNKSITIYPNPASDRITIKHEANILIDKISLLDLNGKIQMIKLNSDFVNLKNLNSGLYILKIETNEGVVNKKLIVE